MNPLLNELSTMLQSLGESFEYCVAGRLPAVLPGLDVHGVGPVGLPISPINAQRLSVKRPRRRTVGARRRSWTPTCGGSGSSNPANSRSAIRILVRLANRWGWPPLAEPLWHYFATQRPV
jgi:hypothetical protein